MEKGNSLVKTLIVEQRQDNGKQKQKSVNYTKFRIIKV